MNEDLPIGARVRSKDGRALGDVGFIEAGATGTILWRESIFNALADGREVRVIDVCWDTTAYGTQDVSYFVRENEIELA